MGIIALLGRRRKVLGCALSGGSVQAPMLSSGVSPTQEFPAEIVPWGQEAENGRVSPVMRCVLTQIRFGDRVWMIAVFTLECHLPEITAPYSE